MIITTIVAMFVLWCMLYQILPLISLFLICILFGGIMFVFGRHEHGAALVVDLLAQHSKLNHISAGAKLLFCIIMIILCIVSKNPITGLLISVMMFVYTVLIGRIHLYDYLCLLSVPLFFLEISGIALLWEYGNEKQGVIAITFAQGFLFVSKTAQARTILILSRAVGAITCLYFLNLSTTVSELTSVCKRVKVPSIVIELMYLIYRYIFILLEVSSQMRQAALSRLGYVNYKVSIHTTAAIYANLLMISYRKAGMMFDAMVSRCYDGDISFLEKQKKIGKIPVVVAFCSILMPILLELNIN